MVIDVHFATIHIVFETSQVGILFQSEYCNEEISAPRLSGDAYQLTIRNSFRVVCFGDCYTRNEFLTMHQPIGWVRSFQGWTEYSIEKLNPATVI